MTKQAEEALESILDLNSNNVWHVDANEIAALWEMEKKDESFPQYEEKLLNTIRLAFEVVHFNSEDEREANKFVDNEIWTVFTRTDPQKGSVAIRRRNISRLNDLSYENIKHISSATLLELIDRNFGGGWDSIPLSQKDIIESAFDVTTTTLPASRIHAPGGTLEKKVADGYDVLEVKKGTWIEAIFAKKKEPVTKLRFFSDDEYDAEGNRVQPSEDDEEEEERDIDVDAEEDNEADDVQPTEDDDTFYSSYSPEAEVKDEEEEAEGLSVLE
ncbi:MAG: hypothetical protein J5486_09785 [Bacteroidaceae bacterium]|nr:hypothetical protein [Bacteroidaceae bacterium]